MNSLIFSPANLRYLFLFGLVLPLGVSSFHQSLSCISKHDTLNHNHASKLRGGGFTHWLHSVERGLKTRFPWLRPEDTRSSKVKYLDTCLALLSEETMASWLERQANVDLSDWGKGGAKDVGDLLKEVLSGESELRSDGTRVVRVAKVSIVDDDFELINTLQVMSNGIVKERNRELSEKFRCDENPAEAAVRGIREELGAALVESASICILPQSSAGPKHRPWFGWLQSVRHTKTRSSKLWEEWEEEEVSTSYPGLRCVYLLHRFHAKVEGLNVVSTGSSFITAEAAASDGHADKLHVWEWRRRDTPQKAAAAALVSAGHDAAAAAAAAASAAVEPVGVLAQSISLEARVYST